jgi:hypothetical protein
VVALVALCLVLCSGPESYRMPSCGPVSAGEQKPALPPDQRRSLYRVRRRYCFHCSSRFSSFSYVLHCYSARTKLQNVELVDKCDVDTGYYAFSPENGNSAHYQLRCSPLSICVRQELSEMPPVYDRLVLMVCPELICLCVWFNINRIVQCVSMIFCLTFILNLFTF